MDQQGAMVVWRAIEWWKTKKPIRYSFAKFLANPTINTTSHEEAALAKAVAALFDKPKRGTR